MGRPSQLGLAALCTLLLGASAAHGQTVRRLRLGTTVGTQHFTLAGVRDAYAQARSFFATQIPVETQREFPTNVVFGAELDWRVADPVTIGLAADYTWTSAYTLYGDATGEFDLSSSVRVLTVQPFFAFGPEPFGRFRPYVELRLGVGFCSYSESVEVRLAPPLNRQIEGAFTGTASGLAVDPALGVEYGLGGFDVGASVGYRRFSIGALEGERTADGAAYPDDLDFAVDASGLVLRLRFGWSF